MGEDISTSWARLARNSLAGTCLVGPFLPWAVLWSWLVAPEAASFMVSIWGTPITSGAMQFTSFIKLLRALFCLVDAHFQTCTDACSLLFALPRVTRQLPWLLAPCGAYRGFRCFSLLVISHVLFLAFSSVVWLGSSRVPCFVRASG